MSSVGLGRKEELLGWEAGLSGGREVRLNEGDRLCIGFKVVAVSKNADFLLEKKRCFVVSWDVWRGVAVLERRGEKSLVPNLGNCAALQGRDTVHGSPPQCCFIYGQLFGGRERKGSIHPEKEEHMGRGDSYTDQSQYCTPFYFFDWFFQC